MSSLKRPIPKLQLLHIYPRNVLSKWQWSNIQTVVWLLQMGHGPAIGGRFWARRFRRRLLSSLLHDLHVFLRPASFVEKKGNSLISFSFLQLRHVFFDIVIYYIWKIGFLFFLFIKSMGSYFFCFFNRRIWRFYVLFIGKGGRGMGCVVVEIRKRRYNR